jgi:hypothetical protein
MEQENLEMFETKKYRSWLNNNIEKQNTLTKAEILSRVLFKTDYKELYTYQSRYIIKQLSKTLN